MDLYLEMGLEWLMAPELLAFELQWALPLLSLCPPWPLLPLHLLALDLMDMELHLLELAEKLLLVWISGQKELRTLPLWLPWLLPPLLLVLLIYVILCWRYRWCYWYCCYWLRVWLGGSTGSKELVLVQMFMAVLTLLPLPSPLPPLQ